eukprot:scaffold1394_cov150-Skeletonema_menzelii.AAC.3
MKRQEGGDELVRGGNFGCRGEAGLPPITKCNSLLFSPSSSLLPPLLKVLYGIVLFRREAYVPPFASPSSPPPTPS